MTAGREAAAAGRGIGCRARAVRDGARLERGGSVPARQFAGVGAQAVRRGRVKDAEERRARSCPHTVSVRDWWRSGRAGGMGSWPVCQSRIMSSRRVNRRVRMVMIRVCKAAGSRQGASLAAVAVRRVAIAWARGVRLLTRVCYN